VPRWPSSTALGEQAEDFAFTLGEVGERVSSAASAEQARDDGRSTTVSPSPMRRSASTRTATSRVRWVLVSVGVLLLVTTLVLDGGPELSTHGNFLDHEYEIERDSDTVTTVSKRWFRVRDTYGVEIAPDQSDELILAITVCIDAMARG
jgi:hypothetical protein